MNEGGWRGIFPVVPTPLKEDESLDLAGLSLLVNHYLEAGCHGLTVLGSGGEHPYFTREEKLEIVKAAVAAAAGRAPVLIGMGYPGLADAIGFGRAAEDLGADGFLVALPSYYPLLIEGAVEYYTRLGAALARPLFYYHFPQITRLRFSARALARILSLPGIRGIKESSLNLREMRVHLRAAQGREWSLFSGNSYLLLEALDLGGAGAICPIPSVAPRLVVDCYRAFQANDREKARRLQQRILELLPLMNSFGLPPAAQKLGLRAMSRLPFSLPLGNKPRQAVIKEAIRQLGHPIGARVRTPLPQLAAGEGRQIAALLQRVELASEARSPAPPGG